MTDPGFIRTREAQTGIVELKKEEAKSKDIGYTPSRQEMEADPVRWAEHLKMKEATFAKAESKRLAEEKAKATAEAEKAKKVAEARAALGLDADPGPVAETGWAAMDAEGKFVDWEPDLEPLTPTTESSKAAPTKPGKSTEQQDWDKLSYSEKINANGNLIHNLNQEALTNEIEMEHVNRELQEIEQAQRIPYLERKIELQGRVLDALDNKARVESEAAVNYTKIIDETKKKTAEFERVTKASTGLLQDRLGIESIDEKGNVTMKEESIWPKTAHTLFWSIGILANTAASVVMQDKGINFPNYMFEAYFKSIDQDIDANMKEFEKISALGRTAMDSWGGLLGLAEDEIELRELARARAANAFVFEIDAIVNNPDYGDMASNPNFKLLMERAKEGLGYYAQQNKGSFIKRKQIAVAEGLTHETPKWTAAAQALKDETAVKKTRLEMQRLELESQRGPKETEFSSKQMEVWGQRQYVLEQIYEAMAIVNAYQEEEGVSDNELANLGDIALEKTKLANTLADGGSASLQRLTDIGKTLGRFEVKKLDNRLSEIDAEFGEGLTWDGTTKLAIVKHKLKGMINSVFRASMLDRTLSAGDKRRRIDTALLGMGVTRPDLLHAQSLDPGFNTLLVDSEHVWFGNYLTQYRNESANLFGGLR